MNRATVTGVGAAQADDLAPPSGTAVVRPLRHVRAVRERYLLRFADPAEAAASRSARAWAWALGETVTAPVTGRQTSIPPCLPDIEAEIAAADERRLSGDHENRADPAATVLRWLIGHDDHVPVRDADPGASVGGFGDVVRSREQIADVMTVTIEGQRRAAASARDVQAGSATRRSARRDAQYLHGVAATLAWAIGNRADAPITRTQTRELTTNDLKTERVHAEDLIQRAGQPMLADGLPSAEYGEGVKITIAWLLGDTIAPPADLAGRGPYSNDSQLPRMLHEAEARRSWL